MPASAPSSPWQSTSSPTRWRSCRHLKCRRRLRAQTALDSARANLDHAQQKVKDLKTDLSNFTVTAPFDGVVYYGELTNGAWQNSGTKSLRIDDKVNPNQVVMTIVAPGKLRTVTEIPEPKLHWIKPGDKARIVPASNPDATTDGVCGAAIPVATSQGYLVPVEPASIDPKLTAGEKASVQIGLPEVKDVLIAPQESIVHGRAHVKLPDGGEAWRDVVIGLSDEKNVEIKSGLNEGDALVEEK